MSLDSTLTFCLAMYSLLIQWYWIIAQRLYTYKPRPSESPFFSFARWVNEGTTKTASPRFLLPQSRISTKNCAFLILSGCFSFPRGSQGASVWSEGVQPLRWVLDCFGVRVLLQRKEVQGVIGGPKAGRQGWTGTGEWQEGRLKGWCNVYLVASAAISSSSSSSTSCRQAQPKGTDAAHRSGGSPAHCRPVCFTLARCCSQSLDVFPWQFFSKWETFLNYSSDLLVFPLNSMKS